MGEHEASEDQLSHGDAGQAIRQVRSARGISLRELARRIGVSAATVSAIETGKTQISIPRLHAIAAALDTSAADLLSPDSAAGMAAGRTSTGQHRATTPPGSQDGAHWRTFAPLGIDPVLAAAIAVFVEIGYHGATMRAIAHRAGMSVPGVYHHYPSKQDLLVIVLDLGMAELGWRVPAARSEGQSPTQRVALIVEALALFHTHRRDLAFIGASEMRSLDPANRRRIAGLRTDLQHMLDAEIAQAIEQGTLTTAHPRDAGRAIATMCTSLPQWFRPEGPTTPEQIATEYAHFALGLLGHRVP